MGRKALSIEEKVRRGTLNVTREKLALAQFAVVDKPKPIVVEPRSYPLIAWSYGQRVLSGEQVACRWVRAAVERHWAELERQEEAWWPYYWDEAQGAAACHFVEHLPHVEGKWASPLIVLEPWQVFLVMLLFGWRLRSDLTRRRFTTFFFEVGRKAAKSTLMAALAYYHLLRENEPGASVVCGATTGLQARMVFGIMQKMGRRSPYLMVEGVKVYANSILTPDGEVKPVNSNASSLDGLNPSLIVLDESHAQDFGLYDVLKSAQGARRDPLIMCPTTAGYDLLSVGYALHQQVERMLEGVYRADHILGVIYTLDKDDDWRDARVWVKANPMLGISPKLEYIEKACSDAQQVPGLEGEFRVKLCSQWLQSSSRWLSMTAWDACADTTLRIEDFLGQPCRIGCDLAAADDLTAVALLFERGDEIVAFLRCYLPAEVVDLRARRVPEYRVWSDDGLLVMTEGTMTDYSQVEADLRADCRRFKVLEIVFDQYGSTQIAGNLANSGLPAVIEGKSAKSTTGPARDLEARVNHGKFRHDGNSLFKWFAANVQVTRRTDDSILPKKDMAESPNKIDGIDALISAMGSRLRAAQVRQPEYQMLILGGKRA